MFSSLHSEFKICFGIYLEIVNTFIQLLYSFHFIAFDIIKPIILFFFFLYSDYTTHMLVNLMYVNLILLIVLFFF